jgi:hypothetical protein
LKWCGAVEVLNQTRPVFKPPLAARTDREMSRPPREQELPNIERECANLVFGAASEILLFEYGQTCLALAEIRLSLREHVLELDLARRGFQP